jgi:hypothetical protein
VTVTMKNAVFWDVTSCGSCKNRHFASIITVTRLVLQLLVTANLPSSPILVTLMMEAIRSSKMSVLTRATWLHIPEDSILHSHCCENLKSYISLNFACTQNLVIFPYMTFILSLHHVQLSFGTGLYLAAFKPHFMYHLQWNLLPFHIYGPQLSRHNIISHADGIILKDSIQDYKLT